MSEYYPTKESFIHYPFVEGHFVIDLPARRFLVNDVEVKLTGIEFRLCWLLVKNVGLTMPYKQIINEVWGDENMADINSLQVHVNHLRDKLHFYIPMGFHITNIRGIGYRFDIK